MKNERKINGTNAHGIKYCLLLAISLFASHFSLYAQTQIALLKYGGGGDWYANPTSLPNLIAFCNADQQMGLNPEPATVDVGSIEIFNYPLLHMTGHGNVVFSTQEAQNLRTYLIGGGFLHIDDNYGLREFIVPQMKKVFLFTWECDLGDGWEDADVHRDSQATRQKALRMGSNILSYVFLQQY